MEPSAAPRSPTPTTQPAHSGQRVGVVRYSGQILQVAPLLYWRLDDPSGTVAYDSSDNSLPGTYAGGVTYNQTGPDTTETDKAVSFNGTTGTVTRPVASTSTANVTLEAWLYWRGGTNQQIVAYNGTPGTNGYGIAISNGACATGTTIELILGGVTCNAISGGTATTNTWYHVVATRSSAGTSIIYVNGTSKGTSTTAPNTPTGNASPSAPPATPSMATPTKSHSSTPASPPPSSPPSTNAPQPPLQTPNDSCSATSSKPTAPRRSPQARWTGPAGYLGRYAGPPITASTLNLLYYNGHGDLAAQANISGARLAAYTYDPFGATVQSTLPGNAMTPRYVGAYSKQLDSASSLISMGARPYDPSTGRFDSMDPVDGGSLNNYDYAAQDPTNKYDLDGRMLAADFSGDTPFAIVTKQGNVTTTTNVQSTQTSSTSNTCLEAHDGHGPEENG